MTQLSQCRCGNQFEDQTNFNKCVFLRFLLHVLGCVCRVLGPVKNRHIYNKKHQQKLKKDIRSQFVLGHIDTMLSPNQHLVHVWQMPWVYLFQESRVACWNLSWLASEPFCSSMCDCILSDKKLSNYLLANQYMVIAICLCKNYSSSWLYRHCHGNRITSWCLCFRTLETGEISHCGYVFWIQKPCSYITYNWNVVIYWKVIWVYYEIMSFSFSDVLSKHFMLELFFCTMPAKIAWFLNHQEVISNYRILKGGWWFP